MFFTNHFQRSPEAEPLRLVIKLPGTVYWLDIRLFYRSDLPEAHMAAALLLNKI